jgi:hypothetical protein
MSRRVNILLVLALAIGIAYGRFGVPLLLPMIDAPQPMFEEPESQVSQVDDIARARAELSKACCRITATNAVIENREEVVGPRERPLSAQEAEAELKGWQLMQEIEAELKRWRLERNRIHWGTQPATQAE